MLDQGHDPLNPFPWYRQLREQHPVYYSAKFKSWLVARYSDVLRVVDDPELFSSQQTIRQRPGGSGRQNAPTLLWIDPPRHRQLRLLISQAFTPRTISRLAPRIYEIVDRQLEDVAQQGQMDAIRDLAYPLPIIVIMELLGISVQDQRQFKQWSDSIVSPARAEKKQAVREMNTYFLKVIEERRVKLQDDLISALLQVEVEGTRLSDGELLSFCRLLLVAGHETSTNLIGNALLTLTEYPETMDELQRAPALIPDAIEEVLRYRAPIQRLRRAATREARLGDCTIKAGEIVAPLLGSANRDERQFHEPDVFDIHRTPQRQIAFGHGIHYCIGTSLARLETRIALEVLLGRFAEIQRVETLPLEPITSAFVYGVKALPLRFSIH